MHQAVDIAAQADENAKLGDVLDFALDLGAHRMAFGERIPRIADALFQAEADSTLLRIDVEDHDLDFLAGRNDLARVDVLLGPTHLGNVDQALDTRFEFDERAIISDVGDPALVFGLDRVLQIDTVPRIGFELLHAEADALGLDVEADDLDLDGLADTQNFGRMADPPPGDIGDMQQAVDFAEIDERAVVGDVLDHALENLPLFQAGDQFGAGLGASLFHDRAARDHDIAAAAIHFENLERLFGVQQGGDVANRADIDLAARQERHRAVEIDGKAALDATKYNPFDALAVFEPFFEYDPGFLTARAFPAEHRFAAPIFDPVEEYLDFVADRQNLFVARGGEFLERNAAFRFQPDIYHRHVVIDRDNDSFDHRSFVLLGFVDRLLE